MIAIVTVVRMSFSCVLAVTVARDEGSAARFEQVCARLVRATVSAIRQTARRRARQQAKPAEVDEQLAELTRLAFSEGDSGQDIANAAGLSLPRIYQIRDGRR